MLFRSPFKPRPGGFVKNNNKPNSPAQNGNGQAAQGRKPAKDEGPRINEEIRAKEVRIVGDNIPQQGVVSLREAMDLAREMELDLVEISPNAVPPVCRIIDYQKYLYQQKKKAKEMKANASKVVIKEIRFGPQTDEHDFQFKLKHAQKIGRAHV